MTITLSRSPQKPGAAMNIPAAIVGNPRGVRRHRCGRFEARITMRSRRIHLGYYDTPEEAHKAYVVAARIGKRVIEAAQRQVSKGEG